MLRDSSSHLDIISQEPVEPPNSAWETTASDSVIPHIGSWFLSCLSRLCLCVSTSRFGTTDGNAHVSHEFERNEAGTHRLLQTCIVCHCVGRGCWNKRQGLQSSVIVLLSTIFLATTDQISGTCSESTIILSVEGQFPCHVLL